MWYWLCCCGCAVVVVTSLGGCASGDPRGEWKMQEWTAESVEGADYYRSKHRAWSSRLEL